MSQPQSQLEKRYVETIDLIHEVKKRPGLYDKTVEVDRDDKIQLWKEIGGVLYRDWESISKAEAYDRVLEIQRKWRSVRDALNRELRYRRQGKIRNRKPYKYYRHLGFITNNEEAEKDQDDGVNDESQSGEFDIAEADPLQTQTKQKPIRKRLSKRQSTPPEQFLANEPQVLPVESTSSETVDSDRLFLLSFAQELGRLPSHINMWARAQIANVMQQAVNCHYNNRLPGISEFDHQETVEIKRRRTSVAHDDVTY